MGEPSNAVMPESDRSIDMEIATVRFPPGSMPSGNVATQRPPVVVSVQTNERTRSVTWPGLSTVASSTTPQPFGYGPNSCMVVGRLVKGGLGVRT